MTRRALETDDGARQMALWGGDADLAATATCEPTAETSPTIAATSALRGSALGTGSTGNAYVISDGVTNLLVDCGLGIRDLEKRLAAVGLAVADLDAILLSHGHDDHVRGAIRASCGTIPVWSTRKSFVAAAEKCPARKRETPLPEHREIASGKTFAIGSIEVTPHPVPHDWPGTFAFVFSDGAGGRIGIGTDIGHPEPGLLAALSGCDVLFFEFNHDPDLLRIGPYPPFLKMRVAGPGGHLSNDDAAGALERLVGADTKQLVAVHLSQTNNRPELVEERIGEAVDRLGGGLATSLSMADRPTPFYSVAPASQRAVK